MEKLIQALQILLKYGNPNHPTHCEHDVLTICGINPIDVSPQDIMKLADLGFFINNEDECFQSYRYGSA